VESVGSLASFVTGSSISCHPSPNRKEVSKHFPFFKSRLDPEREIPLQIVERICEKRGFPELKASPAKDSLREKVRNITKDNNLNNLKLVSKRPHAKWDKELSMSSTVRIKSRGRDSGKE
jgi:hypothetical protein